MKKYTPLLAATLSFLMMTSVSFASNYGDSFGYSTKGMSLGGAMCARVDDWSSVYYNMAGLGKTVGLEKGTNQIALQYQGNMPVVDIDINRMSIPDLTDGRTDNDVSKPLATNGDKNLEAGTFILGLAFDTKILMDLPSFISSARLGVGLCINDDMTAIKINDLDVRTHTFMRYGREAQHLEVLSGLGLGFAGDLFGIGLGVNSAFAGDGNVMMEEIKLQTEEQAPIGQATMNMELEPHLLAGLYFSPGKAIEALEGLDFGFAYQESTIQNIYPMKTIGLTETGGIPLDMVMALTDFYQPSTYTLGMAYAFGSNTVSFDLEYQEWSGFKLSDIKMAYYGNELKKFDDILVFRLGLENRVSSTFSLMFGYYYEPSFVPDEAVAGAMNFLENDKHVGSVGFAWDVTHILPIKGNTEVVAGYQLQYLVDRDVVKDSPTLPNPNYSYGGMVHSFMVGLNISL
jgi:hypothetical protein